MSMCSVITLALVPGKPFQRNLTDRIAYVGDMARKRGTGLTEEQAAHLAGVLRPYLDRYEGNGTRLARAMDVSQSQLSQLLSGRGRGAGVAVLCRIRQFTGISIDDILGLPALTAREDLHSQIRHAVKAELAELQRRKAPVPAKIRRVPREEA